MNNIEEAIIEVEHAKLERYSEDSLFKSKCPVCDDGVLLLRRHPETFILVEYDACILCGQHVCYTDIDELNKMFTK